MGGLSLQYMMSSGSTDSYLYITNHESELWRIDISNPSNEGGTYGRVGSLNSRIDSPGGMTKYNDYIYLVDDHSGSNSGSSLWIIDPFNPGSTSGIYGKVGNLPTEVDYPGGIAFHDGNMYVVNFNSNLWRINPSNPSSTSGIYGLVGSLPSGLDVPIGDPYQFKLSFWSNKS